MTQLILPGFEETFKDPKPELQPAPFEAPWFKQEHPIRCGWVDLKVTKAVNVLTPIE